jgi:hypothetical protein
MHALPCNSTDHGISEPPPIFPCRPCQTVKNLSHSLKQKAHRRSRHYSATDRVNMRQLTAGVHFLGGRLSCLLSDGAHREGYSVCIRKAATRS